MSLEDNIARRVSDIQEIDDFSMPAEREKPISTDMLLSAVANDHRRAILHSLNGASDRTVEYDALVDSVADRVGDENAEGVSDKQRQHIRLALHHTHLPKLVEARMIDYEADTGLVQFVGGDLEQDILTMVEANDADE